MIPSVKPLLCDHEEGPEFHLQHLCTTSQTGAGAGVYPALGRWRPVGLEGSLASLVFETASLLSKPGAHSSGETGWPANWDLPVSTIQHEDYSHLLPHLAFKWCGGFELRSSCFCTEPSPRLQIGVLSPSCSVPLGGWQACLRGCVMGTALEVEFQADGRPSATLGWRVGVGTMSEWVSICFGTSHKSFAGQGADRCQRVGILK